MSGQPVRTRVLVVSWRSQYELLSKNITTYDDEEPGSGEIYARNKSRGELGMTSQSLECSNP